ncbi:MAG TPA: hypothetical protein VFA99_01780 [Acidobacteriaceae bacterium]|nr:hypothetical protein [Acidobacteriaceae bacterium]
MGKMGGDNPRTGAAGSVCSPDTDGKIDTWVLEFARRTRNQAMLLTSDYYGMGPTGAPGTTADRLLPSRLPGSMLRSWQYMPRRLRQGEHLIAWMRETHASVVARPE